MIPIAKPFLTQEEADAASEVILSGWVAQGPKVFEFEDAFSTYVGSQYACAVSSCTAALHLALLAVGVRPGDSVVTVSHSFIATANAVAYCGAKPLFIDIELPTYNMSPTALSEILDKRKDLKISAIIVVHQMGMPCNLKEILSITGKHNIPVVEDAACALGSEITLDGGTTWERIGKPHGDIACFSFHPRKILTTGEGGMLTTNNVEYDKKIRLLKHQGMSVSDLVRHSAKNIILEEYPVLGFNYRMTDIQAAIGIVQLRKLPGIIKRRREIAAIYIKGLSDVSWLQLPEEPNYCQSNWQSFPIRLLNNAPKIRDEFMQYLLDRGVSTRPGIMNAHQEKPYLKENFILKNSEIARNSVMILPLFHSLKDSEVLKIIELIKNA